MYYTIDNAKEIKAEERAYEKWEREVRNRILSMTNQKRKQELWSQYFPVMTLDDSYLSGDLF